MNKVRDIFHRICYVNHGQDFVAGWERRAECVSTQTLTRLHAALQQQGREEEIAMTCRYCRAANSDGEHRCQRCGRRLDTSDARPSRTPYAHTATAPALDERPEPTARESRRKPEFVAVPGGAAEPRKRSWQPSLFGMRDLGQVV